MKTNLEDDDHAVKESVLSKAVPAAIVDTSSGDDLQDSEVTSPTEAGSYSEEEVSSGGWLGGITADFRTLAASLKETAGGVVGFVHRSALSVAAEIAELERGENEAHDLGYGEPLRLPWELQNEDGANWEDFDLKDRILSLSSDENNFLKPFPRSKEPMEDQALVLDEPRIYMIRKLLEIDQNLASTHARLSGRSHIREAIFWRNYFYHCEEARNDHLQRLRVQNNMTTALSTASLRSNDSLIPDDERSTQTGDDSSYVCVTSAPTSLNSLAGIQSLADEDIVVIDKFSPSPPRNRNQKY